METSCDDILREDNGAKSEIQSLVKLNLKLLFRNQRLGMCSLARKDENSFSF